MGKTHRTQDVTNCVLALVALGSILAMLYPPCIDVLASLLNCSIGLVLSTVIPNIFPIAVAGFGIIIGRIYHRVRLHRVGFAESETYHALFILLYGWLIFQLFYALSTIPGWAGTRFSMVVTALSSLTLGIAHNNIYLRYRHGRLRENLSDSSTTAKGSDSQQIAPHERAGLARLVKYLHRTTVLVLFVQFVIWVFAGQQLLSRSIVNNMAARVIADKDVSAELTLVLCDELVGRLGQDEIEQIGVDMTRHNIRVESALAPSAEYERSPAAYCFCVEETWNTPVWGTAYVGFGSHGWCSSHITIEYVSIVGFWIEVYTRRSWVEV